MLLDFVLVPNICFFISDSALKFVVPLKAATVELDGTLTLMCELDHASGDVVWQRDGREVKHGGRYCVRADGAKRVLTVIGMTKEDEGEYSCECRNDRTSAKVSSKGDPSFTHDSFVHHVRSFISFDVVLCSQHPD